MQIKTPLAKRITLGQGRNKHVRGATLIQTSNKVPFSGIPIYPRPITASRRRLISSRPPQTILLRAPWEASTALPSLHRNCPDFFLRHWFMMALYSKLSQMSTLFFSHRRLKMTRKATTPFIYLLPAYTTLVLSRPTWTPSRVPSVVIVLAELTALKTLSDFSDE